MTRDAERIERQAEDARQIHVKRIYDPPEPADGARVLVDRLWPRGMRKERAALTLWLKEIAPSPELRKWFDHKPERFPEFTRRYGAELAQNDDAVARLVDFAEQGALTILYAARDQAHNEAVVLATYLRKHLKDSDDQHSA